jgi:hypothetical protein
MLAGLFSAIGDLFGGGVDLTPSGEPIIAPSPSYEWHNAYGTAADYQVPAESWPPDTFSSSDTFNFQD